MSLFKKSLGAVALLIVSVAAAAAFPATSTTSLNVRSGPGTSYRVIDTLQPGETVEVTGSSGSWYRLAGGGWASANFLERGGGGGVVEYYDDYYDDYDYGYTSFYIDRPYRWGHRHWRPHRHRPPHWGHRPRPPHHGKPHRPRPPHIGRPGHNRPPHAGRPGQNRPSHIIRPGRSISGSSSSGSRKFTPNR